MTVMNKIAGESNAEMMHPKVIHEQRKALFAEMVRKTGSQQSVLDRLLQEIQFLRDHEGGPMDEEVIDILRGKVAELKSERDELLACLNLIYSWANNWDSEFMNDPDWIDIDYPRIQAAIAKLKGQS